MKIKFIRDVTAPRAQIGRVGDIKEVDFRTAKILTTGGFAKIVEPNRKGKADVDKRPNSESKRPEEEKS